MKSLSLLLLTASSTLATNVYVQRHYSSSDCSGTITQYQWQFYDGDVTCENDVNPSLKTCSVVRGLPDYFKTECLATDRDKFVLAGEDRGGFLRKHLVNNDCNNTQVDHAYFYPNNACIPMNGRSIKYECGNEKLTETTYDSLDCSGQGKPFDFTPSFGLGKCGESGTIYECVVKGTTVSNNPTTTTGTNKPGSTSNGAASNAVSSVAGLVLGALAIVAL